MSYAYIPYRADGATRTFAVPFHYLQPEHVQVNVAGLLTPSTFTDPGTILLETAPPFGALVAITRHTPIALPMVEFTDVSTLDATDLNLAKLQVLYGVQEAFDRAEAVIAASSTSVGSLSVDMSGQRITHIAEPLAADDAATKGYVDRTTDALKTRVDAALGPNGDLGTAAANAQRAVDTILPQLNTLRADLIALLNASVKTQHDYDVQLQGYVSALDAIQRLTVKLPLAFVFAGKLGAGQTVSLVMAVKTVIAASFIQTRTYARVPPANNMPMVLTRISPYASQIRTVIGTITITPQGYFGGTLSTQGEFVMQAGEVLELQTPAIADPNAEDVSITILTQRTL